MEKLIFQYDNITSFQEYLDNLPEKDAVKLLQVISLIQEYGMKEAQKNEMGKEARE
ncbi:hypothetical protein [Mammaliicoccus sciuri]|uniref:hypothetical protein n=1 Tax=Mammaliicoccus sciuri TaxID=1296 RepID=UPI0034DD2733